MATCCSTEAAFLEQLHCVLDCCLAALNDHCSGSAAEWFSNGAIAISALVCSVPLATCAANGCDRLAVVVCVCLCVGRLVCVLLCHSKHDGRIGRRLCFSVWTHTTTRRSRLHFIHSSRGCNCFLLFFYLNHFVGRRLTTWCSASFLHGMWLRFVMREHIAS